MKRTHIVTVIGARPQFVKAAVVSRAVHEFNAKAQKSSDKEATECAVVETLVHTGQHYDSNMSDIFFDEMGIPRPNHNLGIGGGSHGQNTGRMIESIEAILQSEKPDWVLVYGDTDSTLAGTLAAVKLHIPVAHVEAGIRSFNRAMPEEINRVLTDHAAEVLFTPTDTANKHLANEGIPADKIAYVGDVMLDAALYYASLAKNKSNILETLGLEHKKFVLATIHRAENTDDPEKIGQILKGLSYSALPIVWPMHPRTDKRIKEFGLKLPSIVRVIEPIGYLDMVSLECHSKVICTDSGGVQKEAFFHQVPCITVRDETEWVETVSSNWNTLTGPNAQKISTAFRNLTNDSTSGVSTTNDIQEIFGKGNAGDLIVNHLAHINQ